MSAIPVNLRPGRRELRQFGWIALVGFLVLGAVIQWRGGLFGFGFGSAAQPVTFALWGLGALSGLFSLAAPTLNRPLYLLLVVITYPIGLVLSYVIMGTLFYGILTPIRGVFLLIGRDVLHRRFEPERDTYWVDPRPRRSKESYFKQF
jgi:hypothetical protein